MYYYISRLPHVSKLTFGLDFWSSWGKVTFLCCVFVAWQYVGHLNVKAVLNFRHVHSKSQALTFNFPRSSNTQHMLVSNRTLWEEFTHNYESYQSKIG